MAHSNEAQSEQSLSAVYYDGCKQTSRSLPQYIDTTARNANVELVIWGIIWSFELDFFYSEK